MPSPEQRLLRNALDVWLMPGRWTQHGIVSWNHAGYADRPMLPVGACSIGAVALAGLPASHHTVAAIRLSLDTDATTIAAISALHDALPKQWYRAEQYADSSNPSDAKEHVARARERVEDFNDDARTTLLMVRRLFWRALRNLEVD